MKSQTLHLPNTKRLDLQAELRDLPAYISGKKRDRHGLGRTFKSFFIQKVYAKIRTAFLAKSDGGSDEFGDRWKPLTKETIAQRPLAKGEAKQLGVTGYRTRGLLTRKQDERWRGVFASTFKRLSRVMPEGEAKAIAAKTAWAILKSEGAKTKLDVFGNRKVPILRVSGRLLDSLSPGDVSGGTYRARPEQLAKHTGNLIVIGSKVPYALTMHRTRRLWPSVDKMNRWFAVISQESVMEAVKQIAHES